MLNINVKKRILVVKDKNFNCRLPDSRLFRKLKNGLGNTSIIHDL